MTEIIPERGGQQGRRGGRRGGHGRGEHRHEGHQGERRGRRGRHGLLAVRLVEPALLALLTETPQHGYTLLEGLETLGLTDLHPSKVYRTLRMMEDDGWIRSDWDADETQGPPRRVYQLTAEGQDILVYWQKRLLENKGVMEKILARMPQRGEAEKGD